MTTLKELIEHLRLGYNLDDHVAVAIWQTDDVLYHAADRGIAVTELQAIDIIENLEANHDASLGITWDTIDVYLDALEKGGDA